MSNSPPVFTSRRDPAAEPFQFVMDVEHEVERVLTAEDLAGDADAETQEGGEKPSAEPAETSEPALLVEPVRVIETQQHTFTCRAQLTAGTMLDLQGAGERLGYDRFMEQVLIPADRQRWADLIRNPDVYVGEEQLDETIRWVVEQYAARPTTRSTRSQRGPQSTGSGSTDSPTATSESSPPTEV